MNVIGEVRRMGVAAITAYGYERVALHSQDLAIGKWGPYWYVIDTIASAEVGRPSTICQPQHERWLVVEQADARIRDGHYK